MHACTSRLIRLIHAHRCGGSASRAAGGSPEASATFTASANTTQPLGVLSQSATGGMSNFSSLYVTERPGNYSVKFCE